MNSTPWIRTTLLAAALTLGIATAPQAAVTVFSASMVGGDGPMQPSDAVTDERSKFVQELADGSVRIEDFESFGIGQTEEELTLFGDRSGISLAGRGEIKSNPLGEPPDENTPGEFFGRFNTSKDGQKWWETSSPFSISFDDPIAAFGFYLTDCGDFSGTLTLVLLPEEGGDKEPPPVTVFCPSDSGNGSLTFFGFVDPEQSYRRIDFQIVQACEEGADCADDFLGFDDLIIGQLRQPEPPPPNGVPEPGSLSLLALALLGLGWTTRRRSPGRAAPR